MIGRTASRGALACLVLLILAALPLRSANGQGLPARARITAVFDGDTVLLAGGQKVRYLGIDTPEAGSKDHPPDCFAEEAERLNKSLVLGREVSLEYDRETKDRYGRLLAYVVLPDGRCANGELIRAGCAAVFRTPEGFGREAEFVALQREAVQRRAGMWGSCRVEPASFYVGNRRTFVIHRPECPSVQQMSPRSALRARQRLELLADGFRPCRSCKP